MHVGVWGTSVDHSPCLQEQYLELADAAMRASSSLAWTLDVSCPRIMPVGVLTPGEQEDLAGQGNSLCVCMLDMQQATSAPTTGFGPSLVPVRAGTTTTTPSSTQHAWASR